MPKINTVCGAILADNLGMTLVHEHIIAGYSGWECDPLSRPYDREKIVKICLKSLEPTKSFGLNSIIDEYAQDESGDSS